MGVGGARHRICRTQFTRSIHKDIEKNALPFLRDEGIEVEIKEILMIHTDFPILVPPFEACIYKIQYREDLGNLKKGESGGAHLSMSFISMIHEQLVALFYICHSSP